MMRIAYVCADPGVPVFGHKGCTVHVQEVIRAFRREGADIELFATRLGGEAPADLRDLRVHRLPRVPHGDAAAREQAAFAANEALLARLREEEPFDMVYERYALWSYGGMRFARQQNIPGLLEVNAPLIEEQATHRGLVDRSRAEWVAETSFHEASALVAVSQQVADYLHGYPAAAQVHVVPNGVRLDRFSDAARPAHRRSSGTYTVGFVGTLKPWHGLPVLVAAFDLLCEHVPEARLLIIGEGPEREPMETSLAALGHRERACFTGAVPPEAVPDLLASVDVAVAPYPVLSDFYFSPLKVYEYMAAGLPVVASRIGQLEEVIEDGVNGVLCAPGEAKALAAALTALWSEPAARQAMGKAARQTIARGHTWQHVARRLLSLATGAETRGSPLPETEVRC